MSFVSLLEFLPKNFPKTRGPFVSKGNAFELFFVLLDGVPVYEV